MIEHSYKNFAKLNFIALMKCSTDTARRMHIRGTICDTSPRNTRIELELIKSYTIPTKIMGPD